MNNTTNQIDNNSTTAEEFDYTDSYSITFNWKEEEEKKGIKLINKLLENMK